MIDLAELKSGDVIDLYNRNLVWGGICGTLTVGTSHQESGTFCVVEEKER